MRPPVLTPASLGEEELRAALRPEFPVVAVDLDSPATTADVDRLTALLHTSAGRVVTVGLTHRAPGSATSHLREALTVTLSPSEFTDAADRTAVGVDHPTAVLDQIGEVVAAAPMSAVTLDGLLRLSADSSLLGALTAESLAYSMLQSGPEFRRWRSSRPARAVPAPTGPVVDIRRDDATLTITLNRPERRNAFGVAIRDALVDALVLPAADPGISDVVLQGAGPVFCSGGDLDEFGSAPDAPMSHAIRLDRSAGARIHALGDRVRVRVHGACIGAGIELPAFAPSVLAAPGTVFRLPELTLGLVPGAGGTVSVTRRIGRWRCAFMTLTNCDIDTDTALAWGLVDGLW